MSTLSYMEMLEQHHLICPQCNKVGGFVPIWSQRCSIGREYYRVAWNSIGPRRVQPHTVLVGEQGDNERVEGS